MCSHCGVYYLLAGHNQSQCLQNYKMMRKKMMNDTYTLQSQAYTKNNFHEE